MRTAVIALLAALPSFHVAGMYVQPQGEGDGDGNHSNVIFLTASSAGSDDGPLSISDMATVYRHAGIYKSKWAWMWTMPFAKTILVTSSNSAYSRVLKNWRCKADKLGLDYVVIAFDDALEKEVGADKGLLSDSAHYAGEQTFRRGHFNEISCMKLKMVQQIARAGLDVVFSDPDNVFVSDPFAFGASLGNKMLTGNFDYIYQPNHAAKPLYHPGQKVEEANTGFYFVRGTSKSKGVQGLFSAALQECANEPSIDDQTNFWNALRNIREGKGQAKYGPNNFRCANLCHQGSTCHAWEQDVLSYCEMSPLQHPTGWSQMNPLEHMRVVTYHANFVEGISAKIQKLDKWGFWDHKCAGPPQ